MEATSSVIVSPQRFVLQRPSAPPPTGHKPLPKSPDQDPMVLEEEELVVLPAKTTKRKPDSIGAGLMDSTQLYGRPVYTPTDRDRVPRSDGVMYDPDDPKRRVYENNRNEYGGEWLDQRIEMKKALMKDPYYQLAFQVAGRVNRRVTDLIENPLEWARPNQPEPQQRPSIKDITAKAVFSGEQGLAWLPARYSKARVIETLGGKYKEAYKTAEREKQDDERKVALQKGIATKWNKRIRDDQLLGSDVVVPSLPTSASTPEQRLAYNVRMDELRSQLLERWRDRVAFLSTTPVEQFSNALLEEMIQLRQGIAELEITKNGGEWIAGAYESLPGYDMLKGIFESAAGPPSADTIAKTMDAWDLAFNNGLLQKQKLLLQRAWEREKTLDRARAERELFGTVVSNQKFPDPVPPKPPVDVRWIALPEHLGVIFYKEELQCALDQAMQDLATISQKPQFTLIELMTDTEVRSSFFDLVACTLRLNELMTPRRNEDQKLLIPLQRKRSNLLILFQKLGRNPMGKGLYFQGITNLFLANVRKEKELGQETVGGSRSRPLSSPYADLPGRRDLYTVYRSSTEFEDRQRPLTGAQQLEYERSKAVIEGTFTG